MTIYECSEDGCTNFVFDNPSIGCAKHGLTMQKSEKNVKPTEGEQVE